MTSTYMNPYSEQVDSILDLDRYVGSEHQAEHDHYACHNEYCHKRHGLLCRILTRLHLRQRNNDREKLIKEDIVRNSDLKIKSKKGSKKKNKTKRGNKYDQQIDEEDCDLFSPRKLSSGKNFPTIIGEKSDCVNNNVQSNILLCDSSANYQSFRNEDYATRDEYASTEPNDHVYSDVRFGEVFMNEAEAAPLIDITPKANISTGEYVKHQWKGKRAKRARKRIRRVMKATWASLQTGVNTNFVPNTNSLVQVLTTQSSKNV